MGGEKRANIWKPYIFLLSQNVTHGDSSGGVAVCIGADADADADADAGADEDDSAVTAEGGHSRTWKDTARALSGQEKISYIPTPRRLSKYITHQSWGYNYHGHCPCWPASSR